MPKYDVYFEDVGHPGTQLIPNSILELFPVCCITAREILYADPTNVPKLERIALIFRDMDGVAHTTGSSTKKEIRFSLNYVKACRGNESEIKGVLVHEAVHCWQNNGLGTAPGGLVEGIADFVRLRAGLQPPHWNRNGPKTRWDEGYEKTAFFLDWVDIAVRRGIVERLNVVLQTKRYNSGIFIELTGHSIEHLWQNYVSV
ncbi:uncharacterized protein V1516DRAFT_671342 [Lipomyces oligophaga]|uniref:uncharacterized protein n=1 Tax=Lipomyces oligophaga TaxID=45792 RepID=UPI0034CE5A1D